MAKAIIIPVGEEARFVEIDGSLESKQKAVGGHIEPFDVVFGSDPCDMVEGGELFTYVNDEGLYSCMPNRAVYANGRMAEVGYLSQVDYRSVVKEGDLYTILSGDILVVREEFDEDGNGAILDCTEEDIAEVRKAYGPPFTGWVEAMRIKMSA